VCILPYVNGGIMRQILLTFSNNYYIIQPIYTFQFNGLFLNQYDLGEIMTIFYELDLNDIAQKINFPIEITSNIKLSIQNYIDKCFDILSTDYDAILSALLLNEIEHDLLNTEWGDSEELDININSSFAYLIHLKRFVEKYVTKGFEDLSEFNHIALSQQTMTAKYYFSEEHGLCLGLILDNIGSLITLELLNLKNSNVSIKKCENCKKLFIPTKRSDEIYCDRVFKNGKTCKELGYSEKVKNDAFKQAYTKARKTQHARIRYNSHISDYKEKHYEPWKKAAEQARDEFQAENDINGFERWLNEHKNSF